MPRVLAISRGPSVVTERVGDRAPVPLNREPVPRGVDPSGRVWRQRDGHDVRASRGPVLPGDLAGQPGVAGKVDQYPRIVRAGSVQGSETVGWFARSVAERVARQPRGALKERSRRGGARAAELPGVVLPASRDQREGQGQTYPAIRRTPCPTCPIVLPPELFPMRRPPLPTDHEPQDCVVDHQNARGRPVAFGEDTHRDPRAQR